jgi:hypothetical protein
MKKIPSYGGGWRYAAKDVGGDRQRGQKPTNIGGPYP